MKNAKILSLVILSLLSGCNRNKDAVTKRPLVLVTAFEPFGGRAKNGSQLAVAALLRQYKDLDFHYCELPVLYDRGAEKAETCYSEMTNKPDFVLSVGEGACTVSVETRAHNYDHTPGFPDNGGVERKNHPIEDGKPFHEALEIPADQMYCAGVALAKAKGIKLVPSSSPGNYVCNNTAYHLARYFKGKKLPYAFVHVPPVQCSVRPEDAADILHAVLTAALGRAGGPSASCLAEFQQKIAAGKKSDGEEKLLLRYSRSCRRGGRPCE